MKLVEILSQHRRDFKGKYECQGCGHIKIDNGLYSYDDDNYHDNVIPAMKCNECGKSTNDLGLPNDRVATKYQPWEIV